MGVPKTHYILKLMYEMVHMTLSQIVSL